MSAPDNVEDLLTPEQAKLLAGVHSIESDLTGGEIPHDAQGNPVAPVEPVDKVAANRALLEFLVTAATPALPFLPECYTPEAVGNIAGAFTAVEEKYGWDVGSSLAGPELALAVFALPPTVMAYQMGKAHFAEKRAQREAEAKGRPQGATAAGLEGAATDALGG